MIDVWTLADLWEDYSGYSQGKAIELYDKGGIVKDTETESLVFKVEGANTYRVQLYPGAGMTCTCPNGMARGGQPSCYHTAAVLYAMIRGIESGEVESDD